MLTAEFDLDVAKRVWQEEAAEKAIEKERRTAIINMVKLNIQIEQIANIYNITIEKIDNYLKDTIYADSRV